MDVLQAGAVPGWCVGAQSPCVTSGDLLGTEAFQNRGAVTMERAGSDPRRVLPTAGLTWS